MSKNTDKKKKEEAKQLESLKEKFSLGKQAYAKIHKRMKLLNSTDQGNRWKAVGAKFPPYQILPDINHVSYIKENVLASLYTVSKSAQIVPTSEHDREYAETLTIALEHEWDINRVAHYQYLAGERAALLNLGGTQVYWDSSKDRVAFKNIDPIHYMRDPEADCAENGAWMVIYNSFHKSYFLREPMYRAAFKEFLETKKSTGSTEVLPEYNEKNTVKRNKDTYNLYVWWVKNETGGIDQIHTIDNEYILKRTDNIQPNVFPIVELYCNLPGSSLVGVSPAGKEFANSLVYNLIESVAYTSLYKNQRPPKYVNSQSGLNVKAFSKHGDEADRTFVVNGDASKAVHYHEFPDIPPALQGLQQDLNYNIKSMSGVDDRYTGRDTGSIITTGGTEEMLNRVTLIDTPKIMNYEEYTAKLSEVVLKFLLRYAPERKYYVKDETKSTDNQAVFEEVVIDFPSIPNDTEFNYVIQISSELPKNKQRVQAWANNMMEKQMQYQKEGTQTVDIITPEEWIACQDVPYREQMQKRMGIDAGINHYMEAQQLISEYGSMLEQGILPEDALGVAADGLQAMRDGVPTPYQEAMANANDPLAGPEGMPGPGQGPEQGPVPGM